MPVSFFFLNLDETKDCYIRKLQLSEGQCRDVSYRTVGYLCNEEGVFELYFII